MGSHDPVVAVASPLRSLLYSFNGDRCDSCSVSVGVGTPLIARLASTMRSVKLAVNCDPYRNTDRDRLSISKTKLNKQLNRALPLFNTLRLDRLLVWNSHSPHPIGTSTAQRLSSTS